MSYIKFAGVLLTAVVFFFFTLMQACSVGGGMWLAHWSSTNVTTTAERDKYVGVYGGIGIGQSLFLLLACVTFSFGAMNASVILHNTILVNIIKSPMSFFETTPLGRIMNRFTRDTYILDDLLPRTLIYFAITMFDLVGTMVVISYVTPWFLSVVLPLGLLFIFIQVSIGINTPLLYFYNKFLQTSRPNGLSMHVFPLHPTCVWFCHLLAWNCTDFDRV